MDLITYVFNVFYKYCPTKQIILQMHLQFRFNHLKRNHDHDSFTHYTMQIFIVKLIIRMI